jgi:hypothetical protein
MGVPYGDLRRTHRGTAGRSLVLNYLAAKGGEVACPIDRFAES